MKRKSLGLCVLAILALVLAVAPLLVGCGESTPAETKTITVGALAGFSGLAASAIIPTVDAFEEAITFYQEKTPIKGVEFAFQHFDHQLDYSKAKTGYEDLKARGMNVFYCMGGTEKDMLQSFVAQDSMPTIGSYGTTATLAAPWIYNLTPTQTWGAEAGMQYIADTWDYSKGAPKIGHQGWSLATTNEIQEGIDNVLNDSAFAGKFNWVGEDKATYGNAAWSAQCEKFKGCDYVFVSMVSNSLATFVSQMRASGYKGAFVSGANQFTGYWAAVQGATAAADLYGCYYSWWGPIVGSDNPADWYQDMIATTQANHAADSATRLASTGPTSGWATGYVVFKAVAKAVKDVGADKIDGAAINEAFKSMDLEMEGVGSTFKFSENDNCGLQNMLLAKWDVATSKWLPSNDKWYKPVSLPA